MFLWTVLNSGLSAQDRVEPVRRSLDSLSAIRPHLNDLTDISVTKFSVYELLKALAVSNDLNMEVNFSPSKTITCNLKQVHVKDVISYCCSQKSLDLKVVDGIIAITDYKVPDPPRPEPVPAPVYQDYSSFPDTRQESVNAERVIPLNFRSVDSVTDIIPESISKNLQIREYLEQNSLVVSGDTVDIRRLQTFLNDIDKSIPLISIDVIMVDATKSFSRKVGLSFGYGSEVRSGKSGSISPGLNMSLDSDNANRLISSFGKMSGFNLGKVGPTFYADLECLEDAGKITLKSTPKLATLNGHKAVLKSGEVKYYKESQVNIIGTQNPLQSESFTWKNVEASFTLTLTPYVSADSTITLQVQLDQDEFADDKLSDLYVPPGITKRSFNSIIKVKNGEAVILGGIEKNLTDDSARGLPFLARVPVLRLLFGRSVKERTNHKMSVVIKPALQ